MISIALTDRADVAPRLGGATLEALRSKMGAALDGIYQRHLDAVPGRFDRSRLVEARGGRSATGIGFCFAFPEEIVVTWEESRG